MLPAAFLTRMAPLLKDDMDAFVHALEQEPVRAFRATRKTNPATAARLASAFSPTPIPYVEEGFYFTGEGIGHTPLHHAGGIYVQDPGAMTAVAALDIPADAKVLDLCAAPGGKTSQVALHVTSGFILANEYVPSRAKMLVGNLERLGIFNAAVTSLDVKELNRLYKNYFDVILCDAPCSGEGMFRKNDLALSEWSEDNIRACAERQAYILDQAAEMLREGGTLMYSTCTYAPEENEMTVAAFLHRHPDFEQEKPNDRILSVTAPGLLLPNVSLPHPEWCRRFYPYLAPGEGQFCALLRRVSAPKPELSFSDAARLPDKATAAAVQSFCKEAWKDEDGVRVQMIGQRPVLLPEGCILPPVALFSAGVLFGEVKNGRLTPHHQLFSAMAHRFARQLKLSDGDERLAKYLHGEEIEAPGLSGYCPVLYEGMALGGGKVSSDRLKNYYPKGLRT